MKLLILSDLHIEHHRLELTERNCPADSFDAVILAGDIHTPGTRGVQWALDQPQFAGKPVLYVPGNHEYYGVEMRSELQRMREAGRATLGATTPVHVLDRDVIELGGLHVMGTTLWTDFRLPVLTGSAQDLLSEGDAEPEGHRYSVDAAKAAAVAWNRMNDFECIRTAWTEPSQSVGADLAQDHVSSKGRRKLRPADTIDLHRRNVLWLGDELARPVAGVRVVVTHHVPHPLSVHQRYAGDWLNPAFANQLSQDLFEGVGLWVHGHTHDSFDFEVPWPSGRGACRVVCNPRGYLRRDGSLENSAFNPGLVIEL